jgi:vacuolar-type H+-ATPase subunit E/Vma4
MREGKAETAAVLVRKIEEEAKRKAEEILKERRKQARKALEEARKRAEDRRRALLNEARARAESEKEIILRKARSEARWMKLTAREELIDRVFKLAEDELEEAIKDRRVYARVLRGLVEEAAVELGGGSLMVLTDASGLKVLKPKELRRIAEHVEKKVRAPTKLELSSQPIDTAGVIVRSGDGSVEVNNTLQARMRRLKEALRPQIAKILFSERI